MSFFFFPPLFCRLLHRKRYWKPFMVQFLLFHLLICLEQLCRERTLDTDKHVLNVGCLYAGLPLKYKSGVLLEQCCDIHATNTAFFLHATQSATIYCKQEKGGKEKAWVQRSPSPLFFTLSFLSVSVFFTYQISHLISFTHSDLRYRFLG